MRRLLTLIQRELSVFYYSPIAYIVLFLFLVLNGLSFWFAIALLNRAPSQNTVVQVFFNSAFFWIAYLLVFPVITMRSFAEEFKLGTIETLMTAPVRDWEVVFSKVHCRLNLLPQPLATQFIVFSNFRLARKSFCHRLCGPALGSLFAFASDGYVQRGFGLPRFGDDFKPNCCRDDFPGPDHRLFFRDADQLCRQ